MKTERRGAALVVVVLVLLAMAGLAHGVLLAARSEVAAATAGARQLALRAAAHGALTLARAVPPATWMDSVSLWDARPVAARRFGAVQGVAAYRRVSREGWLIEAVASPVDMSAGSGWEPPAEHGTTVPLSTWQTPSRERTGVLVWAMEPAARAAALEAVLQVDTGAVSVVDGLVDGVGYTDISVSLPGPVACARWSERLDSLGAPYRAAVVAAPVPAEGPGLGLLGFDSLVARAGPALSGVGTPAPAEMLGSCDEGALWNWGDPARPSAPCGPFLALRRAHGPLRVEGGAGQGVLLVDGDVALVAGARYYGLVLTTGLLRIEDGAELVGAAVAAGGVHVSATGRARGSGCAVARALDAHRAVLGGSVVLEGPSVGPF